MHGHLNVRSNFLPCRKQIVKEFYAVHFRALITKIQKVPINALYYNTIFFYN